MSYVGEEIRAQEQEARRLSAEIADDGDALRRQLAATEWQSGAGEAFRAVLQEFLDDMDASRTTVAELSDELHHHASTVESHEKILGAALHWPVEHIRHGAETLTGAVHSGYAAASNGWVNLTHVSGSR